MCYGFRKLEGCECKLTAIRWDDWVHADRVRKLTEENKELAQNLKKDFDAARRPPPKQTTTIKRGKGSDQNSNRASEERNSSVPAAGRGQKRGRDYELDRVSGFFIHDANDSGCASQATTHTPTPTTSRVNEHSEFFTPGAWLLQTSLWNQTCNKSVST